MVRQADLIKHLPQFMRGYEEIKRITAAENPEFRALFDASEEIRGDLFVMTCGERGIERFEKLLGITANPRESLETRITRVIIRMNAFTPITLQTLIERLDVICGRRNYELSPDWNEYYLKIVTRFDVPNQTDEFRALIGEIVPANIRTEFENRIELRAQNPLCTGGYVSVCRLLELSDSQPRDEIPASASPVTGGYISCCETLVSPVR